MKAFFLLSHEHLGPQYVIRVCNGAWRLTGVKTGAALTLGYISEQQGELGFALEDSESAADAQTALDMYIFANLKAEPWSPPKAPKESD